MILPTKRGDLNYCNACKATTRHKQFTCLKCGIIKFRVTKTAQPH